MNKKIFYHGKTNLSDIPFVKVDSSCTPQTKFERAAQFCMQLIAMLAKYFYTLVFVYMRVKSSLIFPEN